jgi:hypothetical protein
MNFVALLRKQIEIQEQAIRTFKLWMFGVSFVGLILITLSFILPGEQGPDWLKFGSGIFTGALAGFPLSQIAPHRERIVTYMEIMMCFDDCEGKEMECREECIKFASKVIEETSKR